MSNYLADRRKELDLTQKQIATAVGVSEATVSRWESGAISNMRRDKIALLARVLRVSPEFIMTGQPSVPPDPTKLPAELEPYTPKGRMPLLGRVAAGLPLFAEENIEGYIASDFDDREIYYALRVCGDSMNAAGIDNGDIVVVRQQSAVEEHEIAVVLVNGDDATIKYFKQEGDMVVLTPKSHNPVHQTQIYNLSRTPVRIIGRVIQVRKNV